jgi:hypothetical protein
MEKNKLILISVIILAFVVVFGIVGFVLSQPFEVSMDGKCGLGFVGLNLSVKTEVQNHTENIFMDNSFFMDELFLSQEDSLFEYFNIDNIEDLNCELNLKYKGSLWAIVFLR